MGEPDIDILFFFREHPGAFPLYARLEEMIVSVCPAARRRVQKTQIRFSGRHVFACVSFARVKRKSDLPDPYLVLTLGLPCPPDSERAAVWTEIRPGRWTVHIVLSRAEEIDAELAGWIRRACAFADRKT